MITDTALFRNPYYHTTQDQLDTLNFEKMTRVVHGLHFVIKDLSQMNLQR